MHSLLWRNGALVEDDKWKPHQREILIRAALTDLREVYTNELHWPILPVEDAFQYLNERPEDFVFVFTEDGGVICAGEGTPWFAELPVLSEEFVSRGMPTDTTVAVLRALAQMFEFTRFTVGTRAVANQRHAGLAKHYQQSGMSVSTVELMGVINE